MMRLLLGLGPEGAPAAAGGERLGGRVERGWNERAEHCVSEYPWAI